MDTKEKQPRDIVDEDVSFARWFPEDDTITAVEVEIDVEGELECDSTQIDELTVKVWLSGGEPLSTYKVTVLASTAGGRVKETEFRMRVKDT